MKIQQLVLLCALVAPFFAQADWIVVHNVETASMKMHQTNQITIKVKGTKIRIDSNRLMSQIKNIDSGDKIELMHSEKKYLIQSASQTKEAVEMIANITSQADNETESTPKLQPTGKIEKICGFDAEEFVWEGKNAKGRYWIARAFPHYAEFRDAMEKSFAQERKMASYRLPDTKTLPGLIVRSEQVHNLGMKAPSGLTPDQARQAGFGQEQTSTNVMTLVSAKEETVSDSEFVIPADYTEMGAKPLPSKNSAGGLRDVLKAMEKQGLPEADRKAFEKIVNASEAKAAKDGK